MKLRSVLIALSAALSLFVVGYWLTERHSKVEAGGAMHDAVIKKGPTLPTAIDGRLLESREVPPTPGGPLNVGSITQRLSPSMLAFVKGMSNYRSLYKQLKRDSQTLTHDDLIVLERILIECTAARSTVEEYRTAVSKGRTQSNEARERAARTLDESCSDVSATEADLTELRAELIRRKHASNNGITAAAYASIGSGAAAISKIQSALGKGDVMAQREILGSIGSVTEHIEYRHNSTVMSISSRDLQRAWDLAMCELAGGCQEDSPSVLGRCVMTGQCDANSPTDAIYKYEPENYARLNMLRLAMLDSIFSGKWDWLGLTAPQGAPVNSRQN